MASPPRSSFTATRWTLVHQAGSQSPESHTALRELCQIYYEPVVRFITHWRHDHNSDAARENAHAFFESILSRNSLGQPEHRHGRFRNYLLGAAKHFLLEQQRVASTAKRGGDATHEAITENDLSTEADHKQFDRAWALTIIQRALDILRTEMAAAHKTQIFATLKPWLDGNADTPQSVAAQALGLTETATKVAIHRLRQRFRAHVRNEVAATLADPSDLEEELAHLIAVLTNTQSNTS